MDRQNQKSQRRKRYKGTHPRNYSEKYKELQPDKYPETVSKVIQKGSTPVGMHIPICVEEILEFFQIKPGQIGLDATLGHGGHSSKMLKYLQGRGHLYGLDVDAVEMEKTKKRIQESGYGADIFTPIHINFGELERIGREHGPFDFILADLGVSSMQLDNPERGFSYKADGPLDLRLDSEKGISAAERLANITREELMGMLTDNADEPYAAEISKVVIARKKKGIPIATTSQLKQAVEEALNILPEAERKEAVKKSCQRTFQALRIDVNNEFEVLYRFLECLPGALKSGGRAAILTFHSGEDRLVKQSFRQNLKEGIYSEISKEVIRPSAQECARNLRARSTKMRWAIKA